MFQVVNHFTSGGIAPMKMLTTIGILLLCVAMVLAVFGCGQEPEMNEPIKIGAIFSVTGGAALLGGPEKNAAEMIVAQINADGGVDGRMIELIVEDDQGVEENSVNSLRKLIDQDNVVAVIGPTRSGNALAITPLANEAGVPLVSCAAAVTQLYPDMNTMNNPFPYVFKTPQNDSDCAPQIFKDCQARGYTNIAIVTGTTGFGAAGREELLKLAPDYGITIVADETYPGDATDLTPILTKIKSVNPQAVINWSIVPAQALIAGQMKQLGMTMQLYQSHGFGNTSYITPEAENVIFPAGRLLVVGDIDASNPQYDVLSKFKQDYEATYGGEVSTFAGHAYDALWLVVNAIKSNGATRDGIRAGVEATNGFVGTAGIFNMSPTDHCGLDASAFGMITVKDGKFRLLSAVEDGM